MIETPDAPTPKSNFVNRRDGGHAGPQVIVGDDVYCCRMRAFYVVGIAGENRVVTPPAETASYVIDWNPSNAKRKAGSVSFVGPAGRRITIQMRFCPFCGAEHKMFI